MKIEFQIGINFYEVRKPSIRDYYKIKQELAFNETPGFFLLSFLSGCPEEELRRLDIDQYQSLWEEFETFYTLESQQSVLATPVISLNKKDYGLIKMDKMTIGEFADLDIILNSDNSESRLHELMAIFYREIAIKKGESYVLVPYDLDAQKERAELFLDLPVSFTRGVLGFFLLSGIHYIEATAASLEKDPELKTNLQVQESLLILKKFLGDGSELWYFLPEIQQLKSTEQHLFQSTQPSTTSSLNMMKPKQQNWLHKKLFKNISAN
jgi:hypothetical protein